MQKVETMTPNEAACRMRAAGIPISTPTLREGLKQGVYPWGLCIETDRSPVFQIFVRLFEQWLAERAVEVPDDGV